MKALAWYQVVVGIEPTSRLYKSLVLTVELYDHTVLSAFHRVETIGALDLAARIKQ